MINYPVHYDEELGGIYDQKCHFICDVSSKAHSHEMVKRINMHDELVKSLQFLTGIVGGNFCQDMVIKRKYKEARELLEKCK